MGIVGRRGARIISPESAPSCECEVGSTPEAELRDRREDYELTSFDRQIRGELVWWFDNFDGRFRSKAAIGLGPNVGERP